MFLRDEEYNLQLTVLTDRSQGGSSLQNGSLELMLHRRLVSEDGRGLDEILDEPGYNGQGLMIRGKHFLVLSSIEEAASIHRPLAQEIFREPLVLLQNGAEGGYLETRPLMNRLPSNVHLLTLQTPDFNTSENTLLIRLEHFFEVGEDLVLSKPATVNLSYVLEPSFSILQAEEMTLTGTQSKASASRLKWIVEGERGGFSEPQHIETAPKIGLLLELQPMEIRTILLQVNRHHA